MESSVTDIEKLNPAQREAVDTLEGPLLVLAGAGTGKTRVVTCRIAHLIRRGTRPERILAVTFTNKAARTMQERTAALAGKLDQKPEISTFHSLCVRILRRNARRLGYPQQFAIYDRGEQESVARTVLREIKVPSEALRSGDLLAMIGRWKMRSVRPDEAAAGAHSDREHLAAAAYRRYAKTIRAAGAVDFDDLLLLAEELFERFPEVRRTEAARFTHVLVDEYQDTNASQYRIIKALAAGHRNLCVVGDDDQSIYAWRGAEVAHILRFRRDWPDAKVVRLEENYRSTAAILSLANRLIAFNSHRHEKILRPARPGGEKPLVLQCQDEADEARRVVSEIRSLVDAGQLQPRDVAILMRTNEQPRAFELELRKAKLPYVVVGGMSFYDRREVRDVLAYFKLLCNPADEISLLRVINVPPRGIGQRSVLALSTAAVAAGRPLWQLLAMPEALSGVNETTRHAVGQFRATIENFRSRLTRGGLVQVASALLEYIDYRGEIARTYTDTNEQQSRWAAVEEMINALAGYERRAKKPTLQGFLDDITLTDRDAEQDKDSQLARNAVAVMTLHSAKGLEFPHVYLVGMEEGLLPHRKSIEADGTAIDEERRLCYVGITRAQDRLTISLALSRMKWGKPRPTQPSRFLFELTGQADSPRAPQAAVASRGGRSTAARGPKRR